MPTVAGCPAGAESASGTCTYPRRQPPGYLSIKRRIVRGFHPRRIVLFGSQARGTAQRGSDIDLLVVMDAVEGRRQLAASMYAALSGIPVGTDIVVATTADLDRFRGVPGTILGPALEEGRSLYVAA